MIEEIKEINSTEEKAQKIIEKAQIKAQEILNETQIKINKFKQENEKNIQTKITAMEELAINEAGKESKKIIQLSKNIFDINSIDLKNIIKTITKKIVYL